MTKLVEERNLNISLSCRLFGHCRQAWYQSKADIAAELERDSRLLANVREIREEDPRIGGHKLWLMLCDIYGRDKMMGRDSFLTLLRRHGLMLPAPKARCTTNSNHRFHKWKNLIKGFVPMAANQLWVADITYIAIGNGDVCYLHLITDAYSHKIIGWVVPPSPRRLWNRPSLKPETSCQTHLSTTLTVECNTVATSMWKRSASTISASA